MSWQSNGVIHAVWQTCLNLASKKQISKSSVPTKQVRIFKIYIFTRKNDLTGIIVVFLDRLKTYPPLPLSHISHLGTLYRVSTTSNAEIRLRFYAIALADPQSSTAKLYASEAVNWAVGDDGTGIVKGRMKFCRPIFRDVHKVDSELSVAVFTRFKDAFHPIARKLIEKVCNNERLPFNIN